MSESHATSPNSYFTADHRSCDRLWADVEAAVDSGDDGRAARAWAAFNDAMERHFRMEEEVLFPAFEAATGMHGGGPTAVMRAEHVQMRGVLRTMADAAAGGDFESVADHGDTLLMLIQQHNVKEEGILYPMADNVLMPQWSELSGRLARV